MGLSTDLSKRRSFYLFIGILIIIYCWMLIPQKFSERPQSVHMWAMCDRASVARNYAQESMNFFLPRTNMTKDGEGITGLEFPLMNYAAAICYKVFGFHEGWYRLLMLLLVSAGVIAMYKISTFFVSNKLVAMIPPLIMVSSPVLIYYLASFIPDAASLGCILLAWYFFLKLPEEDNWWRRIAVFVLITLGCLMKITSLITVVVMAVLLMLDYFKLIEKDKQIFKRQFLSVGLLILGSLITVAWYKYASWLNVHYNAGVFLMRSMTPHSLNEIKETLKKINETWIPFYFYKVVLWMIPIGLLFVLALAKKMNRLLLLITLGLWLGTLGFFYLMMIQFISHDYYILTLLPVVFFQFLTIADFLNRKVSGSLIGKGILISTIVILLLAFNCNRRHQKFRNDDTCWLFEWKSYRDYFDVEKYVWSLGIDRHEKVIAISDMSPNIALYFLNLKGWSVPPTVGDDELKEILSHHPKYVVTIDSTQANREVLKNAIGPLIGSHGSVLFYKVKNN